MPSTALTTSLLVSILVLGSAGAQTWTEWSAWSECSRTCDGGASYQLRKCPGRQRCEGDSIQYKTCNRNPCPAGSGDFRAQQCAAYNDVIYESRLYEWVPISEPRDPCSLRCRAAGHAFSVMLAPKVLDGTRCDDSSVDICINGRCRKVGCDGVLGSQKTYDRCGVCGGDGSTCRRRGSHSYQQLFRWVETEAGPCSVTCGVGVAKTSVVCKDQRNNQVVYNTYCNHEPKPQSAQRECRAPACEPVWITGEWQECSRPCGAGTSRRHAYCVEELHDGSFRNTFAHLCVAPRPTVQRPCNLHACPKWYAGSWSPCSVTCAKGFQHREVICRRTQHHGCRLADRPPTRRPCDTYLTCMGQKAEAQRNRSASIIAGNEREFAWKSKSNSATEGGHGHGETNDTLREDDDANSVLLSSKSDSEISDFLNQMLQGNLSTLPLDETSLSPIGTVVLPSGGEITSSVAPPGSPKLNHKAVTAAPRRVKVKILKEKADGQKTSQFVPGGETGQEVYFLHASGRRTSFLEPYLEGRLGEVVGGAEGSGERPDDEVLSPDGDQEPVAPPGDAVRNALSAGVSTVPRFIASEWGVCSATCGFGIRTRLVICKVYLKFSQTIQDLPDGDCTGEKPQEVEQCIRHECPESLTPDTDSQTRNMYRWRHDSYSPCNATCLGGVQAPTYKCIELVNAAQVDETLCVGIAKPLVNKVPCNEIPCPPRWRVDQFRPCSALCGGGHRRRRVECIQQLARGVENVAVLPDTDCPPPVPPRSILCNLIDCPPSWVVAGEWSRCSMTCGEGLSTRLVLCQQVVAPGRVQNVSDPSICPSDRPDERRPCYNDACPETPTEGGRGRHVHIATDDTRYVMLKRRPRVQLVVGGQAVLLGGVNVVIRCPARHYNRKLVYWRKNDALLPRRGRIKVSRHGALHIKRSSARDAGVYTCVVDANSANISIGFQSQRDAELLLQERLDFLAYHYKDLLGRGRADENRVSPVHHPDPQQQQVGGPAPARLDHHHHNALLANTLPYLYVSGPWSSCSQSCGFRGLQWRNVTCELINESYIRVVDDHHCRRLGLDKPLASQDCGMFKCPHWEIGPWSRCSGRKCSRKGVGTSTRSLYCVLDNGTTTEHGACEETTKPPGARECRHDLCAAQWRPSEWSKCSRSCGGLGMKRRTLRCVWMNNESPAGRHCKGMAKPPTDKACNSPDCRHVACVDKSSTCSMIPRLKLCHVWYRECCWSCHVRVGRVPRRYRLGGPR